jgi:hypothetical protein
LGPTEEQQQRLAEVKQQGVEMGQAMDELEERFLGNQAMVHMWQEMGRRHKSVSVLACQNAAGHIAAMERAGEKFERRQERSRRRRVASASAVFTRQGQ